MHYIFRIKIAARTRGGNIQAHVRKVRPGGKAVVVSQPQEEFYFWGGKGFLDPREWFGVVLLDFSIFLVNEELGTFAGEEPIARNTPYKVIKGDSSIWSKDVDNGLSDILRNLDGQVLRMSIIVMSDKDQLNISQVGLERSLESISERRVIENPFV